MPLIAAACVMGPLFGATHLERYRERRLRALLRHANARIPYYRTLWENTGAAWQDVRTVRDLRLLPVTTKAVLRRLRPDDVLDPTLDRGRLLHHATSGSTGIPTHVWRTPAEERCLNLFRWRTLVAFGLRPGDRLAVVKLTTGAMPRRFDRLQSVARRAGLVDRQLFDCFLPPMELRARLDDFRPHVLSGFARTLVRLARHAPPAGGAPRPRFVITGGEGISAADRQLLRERLGAPVHDIYGTTECNVMAVECPTTGAYHVCDDSVVLEVCRDGVPVRAGEEGDVVVTSLHSYAMPLIRVAVGDRAVAGDAHCTCGSPFSTVRRVDGRVVDVFELLDGHCVHPFELTNQVMEAAGGWVAEFQITQVTADVFVVHVVAREPADTDALCAVRRALLRILPPTTRVDVEPVAAIAQDASGKLHYCRSFRSGAGGHGTDASQQGDAA